MCDTKRFLRGILPGTWFRSALTGFAIGVSIMIMVLWLASVQPFYSPGEYILDRLHRPATVSKSSHSAANTLGRELDRLRVSDIIQHHASDEPQLKNLSVRASLNIHLISTHICASADHRETCGHDSPTRESSLRDFINALTDLVENIILRSRLIREAAGQVAIGLTQPADLLSELRAWRSGPLMERLGNGVESLEMLSVEVLQPLCTRIKNGRSAMRLDLHDVKRKANFPGLYTLSGLWRRMTGQEQHTEWVQHKIDSYDSYLDMCFRSLHDSRILITYTRGLLRERKCDLLDWPTAGSLAKYGILPEAMDAALKCEASPHVGASALFELRIKGLNVQNIDWWDI